MAAQPIAIRKTGLVTSVGLTAPATCAAIRAKITNPSETRFVGADGEWIIGHQVPLPEPSRGRPKLVRMAAMAIAECLESIPPEEWPTIPLLLCVAEPERPGRTEGLDDQLFSEIQQELGAQFSTTSGIVARGRVSVAVALMRARALIGRGDVPGVVIAAVDSLLQWQTLRVYQHEDRLLSAENSDGFIPGEGAGAVLVGSCRSDSELVCLGIGFGVEAAHFYATEPLRAQGLTDAIKQAVADAGLPFDALDYRITDVSGEQYYFKEAALALGRVMRQRKELFDIWHPAECIGESGAVAGVVALAVAEAACRKSYSPGPAVLAHLANDHGPRAAAILRFGTSMQ